VDTSVDELTAAARLLFLHDEPAKADLAIVFGHGTAALSALRAAHAAALYRDGHCPLLLFSGGVVGKSAGPSEAAYMAGIARGLGVPEEAMLHETRSRNTFENAALSLAILRDRQLLDDRATLILVSCPWHMRRVVLTVRHVFPAAVRLLACPHEGRCSASDWRDDPECRAAVMGEYHFLNELLAAGLLSAD
jgi:uncharacterized SAM-binding protein YcdF (DUF218 family)